MLTDTAREIQIDAYGKGWDAGYDAERNAGQFALYGRPDNGNRRYSLGWGDGYAAARRERMARGY